MVQDLGPGEVLLGLLHGLSKGGNLAALHCRQQQVVDLTAGLLRVDVTDNDHRLSNFLATSDGIVWRIDFENAARFRPAALRDRAAGAMLGALLASHAWACRFTPSENSRFGQMLADAIHPSDAVRHRARDLARRELARLRARTGCDLANDPGW